METFMKKEIVLIIIEALKRDRDTSNLYNKPELSNVNIREYLYYLEKNNILKFTMEPKTYERGKFVTLVEFSPDSENRIESLF